jgi:hypothetical protein
MAPMAAREVLIKLLLLIELWKISAILQFSPDIRSIRITTHFDAGNKHPPVLKVIADRFRTHRSKEHPAHL